jgi:hypothetical protein
MPPSLLFPLDKIKPTQILTQYSEWIYFTLILVFFISLAGVSLRKHFDRPYVKPLIIAVGLMLTIGVFRFKDSLTSIFEGWGVLGTVLLVIMGATIPYGLSRGFGLSGGKAFCLTYILFYILSWIQFPQFYHILAENNLGLVNLGLLILFIVSIFKLVKFSKWSPKLGTTAKQQNPHSSEIDDEIGTQGIENGLVRKQAGKITKIEIRTIDDIAELLAKIQQIIETHRNNLPTSERDKISQILKEIMKKEEIFKKALHNLHKLFKRIRLVDVNEIEEQKKRMEKVDEKEKQILKAELVDEEEKLKIEKAIFAFEQNLNQNIDSFNKHLGMATEQLRTTPYPYDAMPSLSNSQLVLKQISDILKKIKALEERLIGLIKTQERLLKREKQIA